MTNELAIAVNRTIPMLHQAAQLHEEIQGQIAKFRELGGELMNKAKLAGQALESAHLSLKSSGVDVKWEDILNAHAPNIDPKQADKYRRFSRGEITDPRQLCMLGFEVSEAKKIEEEQREKADSFEKLWGVAFRFSRMMRDVKLESMPVMKVDSIKREIEPIAKQLWPEKFSG